MVIDHHLYYRQRGRLLSRKPSVLNDPRQVVLPSGKGVRRIAEAIVVYVTTPLSGRVKIAPINSTCRRNNVEDIVVTVFCFNKNLRRVVDEVVFENLVVVGEGDEGDSGGVVRAYSVTSYCVVRGAVDRDSDIAVI